MKLIGAEALVRLTVDHQTYTPNLFLPIIQEDTNLNLKFELYLLYKCVEIINILQKKDVNVFVNFNMSANCLDQVNIYVEILGILSGLADKKLFNLELAEQCSSINKRAFQENLCEISRVFNIFIDDFGTGYCNLDYLINNPITGIKIDKEFTDKAVNQERNFIFIESIIKTSIDAGMSVVIEGIETNKELDWAKKLGCQYGQGYFWNKPLSLANFIFYYNKVLIGGLNEQIFAKFDNTIAE